LTTKFFGDCDLNPALKTIRRPGDAKPLLDQFRLRRQDIEDTAVPFPYARLILGTKAFAVSRLRVILIPMQPELILDRVRMNNFPKIPVGWVERSETQL
jgi:hypothetical protein